MKRASFPLFVCAAIAISAGMVACGHQTDGKKGVRVSKAGEKAQKVSYPELKGKTSDGKECTTGKQEFKDLAALCVGLTEKIRNNDCALEERKSLFAAKKCSGEFKEIDKAAETNPEQPEGPKAGADELKDVMDQKTSKPGDSFNSQIVVPDQNGAEKIVKMQIACADSVKLAADSKDVISIVKGSQVLIARDDQKSETAMKPLAFACDGTADQSTIDTSELQQSQIKVTQMISTSDSGILTAINTQGDRVNVYCASEIVDARFQQKDGITLTPGAILVVWDEAATDIHTQIVKCKASTVGAH